MGIFLGSHTIQGETKVMRTSISPAVLFLNMVLAVLAAPVGACASTFTVTPTGNDTNPGTPEQPLATLEAARDAGARSAFYTVLRLPWELDAVFREWLAVHYPDRAARVMARVQDLHGLDAAQRGAGRVYGSDFASRMKGSGLWADLLRQRFGAACRRLGLNRERVELDVSQFRPGLARGQGSLF